MTHDIFEDELRARLRGATDSEATAFLDVDTASVIDTGHRVVRRRRMAVAGSTLAAVTVLGAGSWVVLDRATTRAVEEVPATRTTMADIGVVRATVTVLDGVGRGAYTVRLDTGSRRVTATATDTGPEQAIGTLPTAPLASTWATLSTEPFVVVGVVPAAATSFLPHWAGEVGGVYTSNEPLPGTPYQAVVWRADTPSSDAALAGFDWSDGRQVVDQAGSSVPSVVIGDRIVYLDRAGDELGVVQPGGSATVPLSTSGAAGLPPVLASGTGDGDVMDATIAVALPGGASDVRMDTDPDVTVVGPVQTAALSGGAGTIALLEWRGPLDTPFTGVSQVSWRDADGEHLYSDAGSLPVPGTKDSFTVAGLTTDGHTTAVLGRTVDGVQRPATVELAEDDMSADGLLTGCAVDDAAVCGLLPDEASDVVLLDGSGRAIGGDSGWQAAGLPGTGAHVLVAGPGSTGAVVRAVRWTDADGRVHTLERA